MNEYYAKEVIKMSRYVAMIHVLKQCWLHELRTIYWLVLSRLSNKYDIEHDLSSIKSAWHSHLKQRSFEVFHAQRQTIHRVWVRVAQVKFIHSYNDVRITEGRKSGSTNHYFQIKADLMQTVQKCVKNTRQPSAKRLAMCEQRSLSVYACTTLNRRFCSLFTQTMFFFSLSFLTKTWVLRFRW